MLHFDMIYLLTAIALTYDGSCTVHIYIQTVHRMTQNKQYKEQPKSLEECRLCPVFASYTMTFALQKRKRHGKTSHFSHQHISASIAATFRVKLLKEYKSYNVFASSLRDH